MSRGRAGRLDEPCRGALLDASTGLAAAAARSRCISGSACGPSGPNARRPRSCVSWPSGDERAPLAGGGLSEVLETCSGGVGRGDFVPSGVRREGRER